MGRAGKGKFKRFEIKDQRSGENNADTTPAAPAAALQGSPKKGKKRKREKGQEKVDFQQKNRKAPYNLPGQKHAQPKERDPLRIFYETLYRHQPDSELAAIWMMEWGLLPEEEAKKVYEKTVMKKRREESSVRAV